MLAAFTGGWNRLSRAAQPSWLVCILSMALSLPAFAAEAPGKMSIVGGTSDVVRVQVKDKDNPDDYFRTVPGGERILVVAEGPATLSLRFRAAASGRSGGTLRIVRDEGPFSDNPYDLARDMNAKVDDSAAAEGNAASVERVLHVRVEEGEHRYEIGAAKGPPLLVRVFKTSRFDPALAPAPEKNTGVAVAPTSTLASVPPPDPEAPALPPMPVETERKPPDTFPTTIERAPASLDPLSDPVVLSPTVLEKPASLEKLPEKAPPKLNPNFHKGFSVAVKGGRVGFLGFSSTPGAGNGALKLSNRIWGWMPVALELSWNVNGKLGLFAEGGYLRGIRPHVVTAKTDAVPVQSDYRAIPGLVGLSYFVPFGQTRFGLRFKAGVGLAYLDSRSRPLIAGQQLPSEIVQSAWGLTATGGLAAEVRVGPGRLSLEGRYLMLRTNAGIADPVPSYNVNAVPRDLGGIQCTIGYRLEL
jgi:hypothetical protein